MKSNEDIYKKQPWSSLDSYFDFCVKHNVYGSDAIALWREMYPTIQTPRVRKVKK
jgi:hypothetical protein